MLRIHFLAVYTAVACFAIGTATNRCYAQSVQQSCLAVTLPQQSKPAQEGGDEPSQPTNLTLTKLSANKIKSSDVTLYSDFAIASPYKFELKPATDGEWDVFLTLLNPENALETSKIVSSPIAFVTAASNELRFRWNPDNLTRYNPQLANSIIEVNDDGALKRVSLREPDRLPVVSLDLNKVSSRFPLSLDPIPDPSTLALRLDDTDCPEPNLVLSEKGGIASLGDAVLLNRSDAIGTQVELRFMQVADRAEIRLAAFYKDANGRRVPLVGKDLTAEINSKEQLLQKAQEAVSSARNSIPGLKSQLDSEKAKRPKDEQERNQSIMAIKSLQVKLQIAEGVDRHFSHSGPELVARVANLKAVAAEGEKLHKSVQLHVSVVARKDGREMELTTFGAPIAP